MRNPSPHCVCLLDVLDIFIILHQVVQLHTPWISVSKSDAQLQPYFLTLFHGVAPATFFL